MKSWKYQDPPQPKWLEFIEWFVPLLMWFPTCIGGWLVYFGMPAGQMLILGAVIAAIGATYFSTQEQKESE